MKKQIQATTILLSAAAIALVTTFAFSACDDDTAIKEPVPDSGPGPSVDSGPGTGDGGGDSGNGEGGPTDCVVNPKTHLEIINACTNAQKITKNPTLNKLLPDGGLPPLL